jgi:hypothetical protein
VNLLVSMLRENMIRGEWDRASEALSVLGRCATEWWWPDNKEIQEIVWKVRRHEVTSAAEARFCVSQAQTAQCNGSSFRSSLFEVTYA